MSKKNSLLPTLFALSSLFNSVYASENNKAQGYINNQNINPSNASNIITHVASFGIGSVFGGIAGGYGHKRCFSDIDIKNKNEEINKKEKTISEKDTEIIQWKKEYDKLKEENEYYKEQNKELKQFKKPHESFDSLVERSGVKWYLKGKDKNCVASQRGQLFKWILKGRCLEECFRDQNGDVLKNSNGAWLSVNCLNYFGANGVEGDDQERFDKIFAGENPVENFDALDEKYKKLFIEMAVKIMLITTLCKEACNDSNIYEWRDLFNGETFKRYHQRITKKW